MDQHDSVAAGTKYIQSVDACHGLCIRYRALAVVLPIAYWCSGIDAADHAVLRRDRVQHSHSRQVQLLKHRSHAWLA